MSHTKLKAAALARVGSTLRGKWHIDRLIDVGGMASVYAATHRNGNQVAIKLLHPHVTPDAEARDRFLREGYVANRVGHPGAVSVLDDDATDAGEVFLVMELLTGQSLEARLEQVARVSPTEILYIADQILDVLAAAHDNGIVHRDIKPANVFLTNDGEAKLLDFGLARVREASFQAAMTRDGLVLGTASYLAPEQAAAKSELIDARTDQWALGATMYRALSGHVPHEKGSMIERVLTAMRHPAPSLATVAGDLPPQLIALIDKALAFEKDARFVDARHMQSEVAALFAELTGDVVPSQRRPSAGSVAAWVVPSAPAGLEEEIDVVVELDDQGSILAELSGSQIQELEPEASVAFELTPKARVANPAQLLTLSMIEDVSAPEPGPDED